MNCSTHMVQAIVLMSLCGLFAGCASATQAGRNTALAGDNLLQITDDMAMKIAASPAVQQAIEREGPLPIVVEPVENNMRAEVLPRGPADAFTSRVRTLLSKHAPDRFIWIMNRDAFNRIRARELEADLGPSPDAIAPRYYLLARFYSLTNETPDKRSSSYLCVYELGDMRTRQILWTDKYELTKTAVKGFLD